MNILISGSIAYDSVMDFPDYFKNHILPDKIHNLSVSFQVNGLKINYGGTAGNIAYNLKLLGESPLIIATAGHDFDKYKTWLIKNRINYSGIRIINKELTALAHIITDKADNQITAFYPGSMKYSGGKIKKSWLQDSLAIVAPGYMSDMIEYPKQYRKNNILYIFDPGQQIPVLSKQALRDGIKHAKAFISNDYELSMVSKKTSWSEKKILDKTGMLITTLGAKGSIIKTKDKKYIIPSAKPKNTSDPTGAGDAYRAGFIKGLVENWPLDKVGRLASIVSVYTVETYGTQNHTFSWNDIKKRYKKNFKENL